MYKKSLLNLFKPSSWKGLIRFVNAQAKIAKREYHEAIKDLYQLLEEERFPESAIYVQLGICYTWLEDFDKAYTFLTKALDFKTSKKDGELFQYLGYVYCIKGKNEEALECFQKAFNLGQKGMNKWVVNQKMSKEFILKLNKRIGKK